MLVWCVICSVFFFQAEDGIRYLVRSRGLGDVYKRQVSRDRFFGKIREDEFGDHDNRIEIRRYIWGILLYLSLIHI